MSATQTEPSLSDTAPAPHYDQLFAENNRLRAELEAQRKANARDGQYALSNEQALLEKIATLTAQIERDRKSVEWADQTRFLLAKELGEPAMSLYNTVEDLLEKAGIKGKRVADMFWRVFYFLEYKPNELVEACQKNGIEKFYEDCLAAIAAVVIARVQKLRRECREWRRAATVSKNAAVHLFNVHFNPEGHPHAQQAKETLAKLAFNDALGAFNQSVLRYEEVLSSNASQEATP